MRKFIVTLMASLLSCSAAFAFWPEATDSSLEVGVGYRQDRLEWKTSSHFDSSSSGSDSYYSDNELVGAPRRLRSELKWRRLQIVQIEARGKYVTCDNIYLRACGDYGWICSGKNTDSDFVTLGQGFEDRSGSEFEFAHSRSKARGNVYDARIAVGYQFKMCDDSFSIAPLAGWSWHGQRIRDRHLRHDSYSYDESFGFDDEPLVVNQGARARSSSSYFDTYGSDSSSSSSHGNHSRYHARWNGPFVGFDFDYRLGCACEWDIFGSYEFHWARYHAKARWNLRTDLFDGFQQRAKSAYGNLFNIGVKYDFCECWTLAVKGEFQWWNAHHGRDRAKTFASHLGNVKTDAFLTIPLKNVKWQSAAVMVDLGMIF